MKKKVRIFKLDTYYYTIEGKHRPNIVCLGVAEIRQFRSGCDQSGPTSTFIPIVERQQSAGVLRFPFLHLLFWIHVLLRELL